MELANTSLGVPFLTLPVMQPSRVTFSWHSQAFWPQCLLLSHRLNADSVLIISHSDASYLGKCKLYLLIMNTIFNACLTDGHCVCECINGPLQTSLKRDLFPVLPLPCSSSSLPAQPESSITQVPPMGGQSFSPSALLCALTWKGRPQERTQG